MSSPSSSSGGGGGGRGRKRSAPHMDDGASEEPGNSRSDPRAPERFVSSVREPPYLLPHHYEGFDFERYIPRPVGFVEDEDGILHIDPRSPERFPRFLIMPSRDEDADSYFPARVHDIEDQDRSSTTVRKRARVPASRKAIQGLREARACDAGTPVECAVCLQDFAEDDKLRAMPCSHAFHQNCIFDWLRRNGVCPLCRYALPARPTDDDDDEY